jgi:hypothetical protein
MSASALSLDLRDASLSLVTLLAPLALAPSSALALVEQYAHASAPRASAAALLDALATLLLEPACTAHVAVACEPLLREEAVEGAGEQLGQQRPRWTQPQTHAALHAVARLLGAFEALLP